jgi:crossover junction endodeoxyribonuclease RuvC
MAIGQRQIPCLEFTPLQIKQAVAGYGQADKQNVQKMVKLMLGLQEIPRPDDAADGLAAALCAAQSQSTLLAVNGSK